MVLYVYTCFSSLHLICLMSCPSLTFSTFTFFSLSLSLSLCCVLSFSLSPILFRFHLSFYLPFSSIYSYILVSLNNCLILTGFKFYWCWNLFLCVWFLDAHVCSRQVTGTAATKKKALLHNHSVAIFVIDTCIFVFLSWTIPADSSGLKCFLVYEASSKRNTTNIVHKNKRRSVTFCFLFFFLYLCLCYLGTRTFTAVKFWPVWVCVQILRDKAIYSTELFVYPSFVSQICGTQRSFSSKLI